MGMDFSALLSCPNGEYTNGVIEDVSSDESISRRGIRELWSKWGFAEFDADAQWIALGPGPPLVAVSRPTTPDLSAGLFMPDGFLLVFGKDTIWIYHPLRFMVFLSESEWQHGMMSACWDFSDQFCAREFAISRDESPIVRSFLAGKLYDQAIQDGADEGESSTLAGLFIESEWDTRGFCRFGRE